MPEIGRNCCPSQNVSWRALPGWFGRWNSVWWRFDRLGKAGVIEDFFAMLAGLSETTRLVQMFA